MTLATDGGPGFAKYESPDAILKRIAKLKARVAVLKPGGEARRRASDEIRRLELTVLREWVPTKYKGFSDEPSQVADAGEQLTLPLPD